MYITSDDSKEKFTTNKMNDFTVEFDTEIDLSKHIVGARDRFAVALTEMSIESSSLVVRQQTIPEACLLMCDICDLSYVNGIQRPILRSFPSQDTDSLSLYLPQYVPVTVNSFNRLRIEIKTRALKSLDSSKWNLDSVIQCTLHFQSL